MALSTSWVFSAVMKQGEAGSRYFYANSPLFSHELLGRARQADRPYEGKGERNFKFQI
jgi:hypothetical protein